MTGIQKIIQSPLFAKQKKRLQKKQIRDMDLVIRKIAEDPEAGDLKVGDLSGVRVFKFKSLNTQFLLAYQTTGDALYLYSVATHENFYQKLKKYIHR
jgi:hypothetical protein